MANDITIRVAENGDLAGLLSLYAHLHNNPMPPASKKLENLWREIMLDSNHNIVVATVSDEIVASCVVVTIPNLTHSQKPYALIENVVTHTEYRKKGYATQVLDYAKNIAANNGCYKIMLMTGSKKEETLRFYERAGYNKNDKTAFIQWLD